MDIRLAIDIAKQLAAQDIPYKHGGNDPSEGGLDCSGFIRFIFRIIGLIPYHIDLKAIGFYRRYSDKIVDKPYAGCLVFYGDSLHDITHVMLAIDPINCVGAASKYMTAPYVQYARIDYRTDIVAIVDPFK